MGMCGSWGTLVRKVMGVGWLSVVDLVRVRALLPLMMSLPIPLDVNFVPFHSVVEVWLGRRVCVLVASFTSSVDLCKSNGKRYGEDKNSISTQPLHVHS